MVEVKDPSCSWHFCSGYLSFRGLKILSHKNMITSLPHISLPSQVCENMLLANNIVHNSHKGSHGEQKVF